MTMDRCRALLFSVSLAAAAMAGQTAAVAQTAPAAAPAASATADYSAFLPDPKSIPFTLLENIPWTGTVGRLQQYKIYGDANQPGPYAVLMKWYPGAFSRPHLHEKTRYITVIQGNWWVSSSAVYDIEKTYPMPAGSVIRNEANQIHWDGAKGAPVVLLISGDGPAPSISVDEKGNRLPPRQPAANAPRPE
jgi:quercetin dioxygenase-like cupin family protein